jgi:hypothetical protein
MTDGASMWWKARGGGDMLAANGGLEMKEPE